MHMKYIFPNVTPLIICFKKIYKCGQFLQNHPCVTLHVHVHDHIAHGKLGTCVLLKETYIF